MAKRYMHGVVYKGRCMSLRGCLVRRASGVVIAIALSSVGAFAETNIRFQIPETDDNLQDAILAGSLLAAAAREKKEDPQELLADARADYQRILSVLYENGHFGGVVNIYIDGREAATIPPGEWAKVRTGLAVEIPAGFEGQVRPRSGLALRHGVTVLNAPGTIDADYRGEIGVILINHGPSSFTVRRGDRIAQLVIAPVVQAQWHEETTLSETDRGAGGFGSTGGAG